jgi:CRISPR-associated protein Cmr6
MPIAAVPGYLAKHDLAGASPALRFGMYLPIWTDRKDQEKSVRDRSAKRSREGQEVSDLLRQRGMDAAIAALRNRDRNALEGLWDKSDDAAREAWKVIAAIHPEDRKCLTALVSRQQSLAVEGADGLSLVAIATAPFTTGLGNEHPLENGFSFLNPYGLPYLPGSGVKGVLRRAAEELASGAWGDPKGWSGEANYSVRPSQKSAPIALSMIDALFGREPRSGDSDAARGVLSFWDVIPDIEGDKLLVEVMTPHQGHYYQQKRDRRSGDSVSPHDSGQPIPIPFLTIPPGSRFTFHVACDRLRLERYDASRRAGAPSLLETIDGKPRWQALLEAAFEHAFEWLGFGAKTAVGYGAMARDHKAEAEAAERAREAAEAEEREARRASMNAQMIAVEEFAEWMARRSAELRGGKESLNGQAHNKARELAKAAAGNEWSPEDKRAAADAIEEWLPKVVDRIEMKDERKKLGLRTLRGEA